MAASTKIRESKGLSEPLPIDISQSVLLTKFADYLASKRQDTGIVNKNGVCAGLTQMALLGLALQYQEPKKEGGYPRDDFDSLRGDLLKIAAWKRDSSKENFGLTAELESAFERIFAYIELGQHGHKYLSSAAEHESELEIGSVSDHSLQRVEVEQAGYCYCKLNRKASEDYADVDSSSLEKLLADLVHEKTMVMINLIPADAQGHTGFGHTVGVFKVGETYFLYDSNQKNGLPIACESLEELTDYIVSAAPNILRQNGGKHSDGVVISVRAQKLLTVSAAASKSLDEKKSESASSVTYSDRQKVLQAGYLPGAENALLMEALSYRDAEAVAFYLAKGANPNMTSENGRCALAITAITGDTASANLLISASASLESNPSPLIFALQQNRPAMVALLLDKGAKVANCPWGNPLYFAARDGNAAAAQRLYSQNSGLLNILSEEGTPLIAAAKEFHTTTLAQLLSYRPNVHLTDSQERTAMHWASRSHDPAMAKMLFDSKADVQPRDHQGRTPLSLAAELGHTDTVDFLLAKQANPGIQANNGMTALMYAVLKKSPAALVTKLIQSDKVAHLRMANARQESVLYMAVEHNPAVVKLLIDNIVSKDPAALKAIINLGDKKGRTPLHKAAEQGNLMLVQLLISVGAKASIKDADGNSPLTMLSKKQPAYEEIFAALKPKASLVERGLARLFGGPKDIKTTPTVSVEKVKVAESSAQIVQALGGRNKSMPEPSARTIIPPKPVSKPRPPIFEEQATTDQNTVPQAILTRPRH